MQSNSSIAAKGRYRFRTYRAGTGELLHTSPWIKNLVSTASSHGLNIIARRMIDDLTYDLVITQAKIGTGTTAAAASDTDLETTTTDGILVANSSVSGATATFEFFIPDVLLPNDTYSEFGIFCEDQLFARSLIDPTYTKEDNEDTSIEYEVTFSNV
jgi:hypothetical protein